MITSIVDVNENTVNPYSDMTLAEACNEFILETVQAVNDFKMNIILTEHAFLYENKVEIQYVNEDGTLNDNGSSLKVKLQKFVQAAKVRISNLINKFISWVKEYSIKIVQYFKKVSISKEDADKVSSVLAGFKNGVPVKGIKNIIDFEKFKNEYTNYFSKGEDKLSLRKAEKESKNSDSRSLNSEKFVISHDPNEPIMITASIFDNAMKFLFDKENSKIVNDIKELEEQCNSTLDKALSFADKIKPDDIEERTQAISNIVSNNSRIAQEAIRIYYSYVSQQLAIVKGVFSNKEIRSIMVKDGFNELKKAAGLGKKDAEQQPAEGSKETKKRPKLFK